MKYIVKMNGKQYEVEVERYSPFHMLTREEIAAGGSAAAKNDTVPEAKTVHPEESNTSATKKTATDGAATKASGNPGDILCPMYGTILSVNVQPGEKVQAGDTVFMIEAMKMETEIVAPMDGTISEIKVKAGQSVEADQVLAVLG